MNTNGIRKILNNIMALTRSRRGRKALGAVVIAALLAATLLPISKRRATSATIVEQVRRGPLTISLMEFGAVRNRKSTVVKNQVEGSTTILALVPEGTQVKQGDLLVELDSSKLQDSRLQQQITVMNAEAAFIRARETLAVTKLQAESDISKAEQDYRFAVQDLAKLKEGDYPRDLQKAEADISIAREELQRALDKLEWSQKLSTEGYLTRTELQADELSAKRAQINLSLAESAKILLENYSHQRNLDKMTSDVEQTRRTLERVRIKTAADIVQADTDMTAKKSEFERQKTKLSKIEEQIALCRITAPVDGMAVYASSAQRSRWSNSEPLEEGQTVRERQELFYLPTDESMMVDVQIQEASLRKVSIGMPVRITIDALPNRVVAGKVSRIAFLPQAQSAWLNPGLKVYDTEIDLEGPAEALRPGMSCNAEIIVAQYTNALFVPVQAVVRVAGQTVVYVPASGGAQLRPVSVGLDNNRFIHILEGLRENESVLLNPPLAASSLEKPAAETQDEVLPPAKNIAPDTALDRQDSQSDQTPAGQDSANTETRKRPTARRKQQ